MAGRRALYFWDINISDEDVYYTSSDKCGISDILPSDFSIQISYQNFLAGFASGKQEYIFMLLIHVGRVVISSQGPDILRFFLEYLII
jgi:hypothetical protein